MNYQLLLDETLRTLEGGRPRLLLHACCAPCASYPLEYLSSRFQITVYFDNPNIMPFAEDEKRLGEFEKLRDLPFTLEAAPWDNETFLRAVAGHERDAEGGARCALCFRLRLGRTAEKAAREGYDYFCSTLTVSPHKDAELLNSIGASLAEAGGPRWLYSDFKKRGGYQRSIVLCRERGIYRQNYCGCRLWTPEG